MSAHADSVLLIGTCMAHTFENCAEVLTGKIIFSPARVHHMLRVLNFISNIVPLSKPKDLVVGFLFGLELQLQKSHRRHPSLASCTLCVQLSADSTGTFSYRS